MRACRDWLLLLTWTAFIWFLSSRPGVPSAGSDLLDTIWRQGGHFLLHFMLLLAAWRAGVRSFGRRRGVRFALVFALANAVLDELYQTTVPGRSANLEDVMTNAAGVLVGVVLLVGWQRRPTRLCSEPDMLAAQPDSAQLTAGANRTATDSKTTTTSEATVGRCRIRSFLHPL